ncbi:Multidrug resistance efflux pump [Pseudobutyrivibrio sp. ACV-2]|uniref:efflux RND transporter periplasmic adaptor subunit n=1 Tax=Pseudobutyrivibrio sp. ACV-2 TaxID=1520801 RepID=UPI000899CD46|nr:efflux RND transporter periplasmic adaptor subunit [Pseudobutyrivibrio sp. ACV-2]SEA36681.1 Multidrug resistance efflux pump [Pseudobutyrivibrio sp. ACV-2]
MKEFFKKIGRFLKKHIKLIIVLVIVVAIAIYVRYSMQKAKEVLEEQANQPVTATIDQMDLQKSVSVTGTLNAVDSAKVTSTIGGTMTGIKVKKINFKEGDYVEAGDVVVEFDGDDYDRKITELNAKYSIDELQSTQSMEEAQRQIEETQRNIQDIQDKIEKDQKWLDENLTIYNNLKDAFDQYEKYKDSDSSVVSRWMSESAAAAALSDPVTITGYETRRDGIKAQQNQIATYQNTILSLQNKIQLAEMNQNYAKSYTQVDEKDKVYESKDATHVSAPISGYIITMNVTEGNNYAQGNTVFTIADTSGFVVEATVNEYDIANIEEGLPAKVKFEATGDETFDGDVTFVSLASTAAIANNAGQQGQGGSSVATYNVKIKLNEVDKRMRVGMTAKASVILDSVKDVLCVPYDCVQTDDDGKNFVTTIDKDGNKKDISVTTGLESDYLVEIKGKNLKKGMTVEAIVEDAPSTDLMDYVYME